MKIAAIVVGARSRSEVTKVDQLAASIERVGLIQPPVVREIDGTFHLVAGQRRVEAMKRLGWTETRVTIAHDLDDELTALLAEGEENTEREPFTVAEAVEHRRRIAAVESALAKQRQQSHGGTAPGKPNTCSNLEQVSSKTPAPKTRHRTAKATGFGATTLDKAERIIEVAEDPKTPEPVREVAKESVKALATHGVKVDAERRKVEEALVAHVEGDTSVANAKYLSNLSRAITKAHELVAFDAERVAEVADDDLMLTIDILANSVARWSNEITRLRSGLRLLKGGAQ